MRQPKKAGLYVRVSTGSQDTKAQEMALKEYVERRGWQVFEIYRDTISGIKEDRPGLNALLNDCRKGHLDLAVTWKCDRLARSVLHLLRTVEAFEQAGVGFISASEAIDTSSPAGKMVLTVLGAAAALERSIIGERVRLGIQRARKEGRRLGRPPVKKLSAEEITEIRVARAKGITLRTLATQYGASLWMVHQAARGHD
jgi:DNA invertase Pin-like site-specific DNA recombinase